MTLRARLTLGAAAAVAVAVVLAAVISLVVVERQLRDQLDRELGETASRLARVSRDSGLASLFAQPIGPRGLRGEPQFIQIIEPDGTRLVPVGQLPIPVDRQDRALARVGGASRFADARVGSTEVRVVTTPSAFGDAVQVARPVAGVEDAVHDLRLTLALVAVGGVGLATALGFFVARTGLRPVARLTEATEHVARTQDLGASIEVHDRGELGRLAGSFNAMLAALADSRRQQRQLVTDASHELRTPLTSLRTNIEVLAAQPDMPADERSRLLGDVTSELVELSTLVNDVVELAREETIPEHGFVGLHLDELVADAVDRAQRRAPGLTVTVTQLEPTIVSGQEAAIDRALANVLDNASTWSPEGATIEVALAGGEVTVRDHGPGIEPEDLPHVFDRFYRAPAARALPGSGLGLAIVRRVMETHGGTATAEPAELGGTRLRLRFPPLRSADPTDPEPTDPKPTDPEPTDPKPTATGAAETAPSGGV
jgi:two-component system sensor histidine kinase MprB